jgi:hypothetical protein
LSVSPKLADSNIPSFKEETDMPYLTPTDFFLHQAIPNGCTAKTLGPSQRLTLGLEALAGHCTITSLADDFDVSRKFVYQQAATAQTALEEAFAAETADDHVLFHLPVTKVWLRQVALGLILLCHSSYRGVREFCRDLLDVNMSEGTVHNIVQDAVDKARPYNQQQQLANIDIAGLDEIFQNRQPVFVGADVASGFCFLLSLEGQRDADTWGLRLLELQERGFDPKATIADFGTGIRAGQKLAMPDSICRGDVFHAMAEVTPVVSYLENRAPTTRSRPSTSWNRKKPKPRSKVSAPTPSVKKPAAHGRQKPRPSPWRTTSPCWPIG